jgi:ferredoxin
MSHYVEYQDGSVRVEVEEDDFILDALLAAGVKHPYSCRQGICTTCRVRVVSGVIEQDPYEECILSQDQLDAGYRLLCVGLARSDAIIQIA